MSAASSYLKLGFAGTPDFAVPALDRLAAQHRVCAVFTQPDRRAGRGQRSKISAVKKRALELGLTVHQPESFKAAEALEILAAGSLDALIVAAYGLILPAAALRSPRLGCFNIHASLLPRWRGAAPIQRALLAGDFVTGITIMRMQTGLDTGPMLKSGQVAISARDTAQTLMQRLSVLGAELMAETLQALGEGGALEVAQPIDGVTYAHKLTKAEAPIDWQHSAGQISRQVRAFNPWPVAQTRLMGEQLRIWEAEAIDSHFARADGRTPVGSVLGATHEGIDVLCGSGILRVLRLQLAGRNPLSARDFLRGKRLAAARFGA